MGFFDDIVDVVVEIWCEFFYCSGGRKRPTTWTFSPPTRWTEPIYPPGPDDSITTQRPDPSTTEKPTHDPEPIWNGTITTFGECEVINSTLFKQWCDAFDPKSNRSGVPRLYADMTCQNRSNCAYRFWFTQDWNLQYKRSCSDGSMVSHFVKLNESDYKLIRDKCAEFSAGLPLYALILIFLGVLTILITLGAFAWSRGRRAKEAIQSQMSRMPTDRSSAFSRISTMRSNLPTTRSAQTSSMPSRAQPSQRSLSKSKRPSASSSSSGARNSARMSSALSGSKSNRLPSRQ